MKKDNGITLIALVITIIVMLILVIVTISFAMNGDLFGKARESSMEYRTAQINEAIALTKADLYSDYYDGRAPGLTPPDGEAVAAMINKYLVGSGSGTDLLQVSVQDPTFSSTTGATYAISSNSTNIDTAKLTTSIVCDFWKTSN